MATLGFLRRDFELFALEDFGARLARIDEFVSPRLRRLSNELAPQLSRNLGFELFAHIARPARRAADFYAESCAAFGPLRAGYKRAAYLALCVSSAGVHARAVVKSDADNRAEIARSIKAKSAELEQRFRGTKIQQYKDWNCRELPRSSAANADFFEGLGDALAKKNGGLDVGFGWPVRDALTIDRAELLDAFRELELLYRVIAMRNGKPA